MAEAPRACTGACDDRRAVLVRAALHDQAVAARDADRRRAAIFEALAERPRGGSVGRRRGAGRVARGRCAGAGLEDEEPVVGWWCTGCGRFEAPRPCLGVCIHRPAELVRLDVQTRVVEEAAAARARAGRLAALARRAAWSSPRAGHEEESARALAEEARRLLA